MMARFYGLRQRCVCIFALILILCLLLQYMALQTLPFTDNDDSMREHQNFMDTGGMDMQTKDPENMSAEQRKQQLLDPLSMTRWKKGIGDTGLSNDGFDDYCVVPNISAFRVSESAAQHRDPLYAHIHRCNDAQKWTHLLEVNKHERYVLIDTHKALTTSNCMRFTQYQSPSILRGNLDKINVDDLWTDIDTSMDTNTSSSSSSSSSSLVTLTLHRLTQSIWIRCMDASSSSPSSNRARYNHYVSVLPLSIRSPQRFQQQRARFERHQFGRQPMPNVVIFVLDSTSRSNFHRGSVSTVEYLQTLLESDAELDYELLQFFRHSTVGWGTGENMLAMIQGGHREQLTSMLDLFAAYDRAGYIVPAIEEYEAMQNASWHAKTASTQHVFTSQQWDQTQQHTFYLTHNVFALNCRRVQYFGTQAWSQFVLDAVNVAQPYDDPLPYFAVVHMDDNHRADGWFQFVIDRYLRTLVEELRFTRTVFHMVADHGSLVGTSTSTQFGRWEAANPVSILWLPHGLFPPRLMRNLRLNQQRFVTHFDFHVFWKQVLAFFSQANGEQAADVRSVAWLNQSLPRAYKNILTEEVSVNRTCDELDAPKSFCFCHLPRNRAIMPALLRHDAPLVQFVVRVINNMTGDGRFDCAMLDAAEFTVVTHLQHGDGDGDGEGEDDDFQLVIQRTFHPDLHGSMAEYETRKTENRILTYFAMIEQRKDARSGAVTLRIPYLERDGMNVPVIERLDYFKYEHCITREYDIAAFKTNASEFQQHFRNTNNDLPPVILNNMDFTKQLLREQNQINLRLCKCK